MPPDPPRVYHALHAIPHPLWKFGWTGFFMLPMALYSVKAHIVILQYQAHIEFRISISASCVTG